MTSKTEECSWREWAAQELHKKNFSSVPSWPSTHASSSSLIMATSSPRRSLKPPPSEHLPWSNQTVTPKPEKLLMPYTKTVSPFPDWRWANSQDHRWQMNSTLSTRASHSSRTWVPSCRATSSQAWSWLPRMPFKNTEMYWAQLTQEPPSERHHTL